MTDFALLGIRVDSKEVRAANKDLDNFRRGSGRASRGAREFESASKRLERQLAKTLGPLRQMRNLLIGVGIVQSAKGLVAISDQLVLIDARVKTVTDSLEEQQSVMKSLRDTANEVGVSLESSAKLFIRTQRVRKDIGATTQDVLKFVQTIQRLTLISGASAQESTAAMIQLSQAIASSRLSGEELRSVMEQVPVIVKTITDEYDITLGQFRKLAEQGKITADVMVNAINNAALRVAEDAAKIPDTVGRAFQKLRNEFQLFTGEINKEFGVTGKLSSGIRSLADNLGTVGDAVLVLASYIGVRLVQAAISATIATVQKTAVLKADTIATIAATAATLRLAQARQVAAVAAFNAVGLIGASSKTIKEMTKSTRKAEIATIRHNKALKALVPFGLLSKLKSLLAFFGGLPGLILLGAGALFIWNRRTKEAEARAESLKEKLLNLGKSQEFVTIKTLEANAVSARSEIEKTERAILSLEKRMTDRSTRRGSAAHRKGIKTRLQSELDEERESLEQWQKALENANKEIEKLRNQKPDDLTNTFKGQAEAAAAEKQLNIIEKYIDKLKISRDQKERLAKAEKKGEAAVAALNAELEIENALRGVGVDLTKAQSDAIIQEVRARQDATGAIEDMRDARKEEAEAAEAQREAAEDAARDIQAPFNRAAENIQRSFGDTFTEIYRNGVTSFDDLADAIKDIMARLAGEVTALMVFRPSILSGGLGGLGLLGGGAATAGAGGGAAGLGLTGTLGLSAIGLLGGLLASGGTKSSQGMLGGLLGGAAGGYGGLLLGSSTGLGPLGIPLGVALGSFLGGSFGGLFGGGDENQKFGFATGPSGVPSPFGNLAVTANQDVDASAIIQSLVSIDEGIADLLSPAQIARVQSGLAGTGQFFDVKSFDNEPFDIVQTRLIRIIDAVAENTVASGLLSRIPRGNIDDLVSEAGRIIELINLLSDQGAPLNDAELALKAINDQFEELAKVAKELGFSIEEVTARQEVAIKQLTTDFNTSIRDQILAIQDPYQSALEAEQRLADERLENAVSLGANIIEVERLNGLRRAQIIDAQFASSNSSINSFLQSLKITGAGGLGVGARAGNAESLFNTLLGQARTDPGARTELAGILPTFLDLKRQQLGSTPEFFQFTSFLDSTLSNLVDQSDTVSTLTDVGEAITSGDNAIVLTLQEEIGGLKTEIVELKNDINLLLNAPQAA